MTATLPLGAGLQPAGTSPAGLGQPGSSGPVLAQSLAPARALDPASQDYLVDASDGVAFQVMTATQQRVILALGTVPGSIAGDPAFGNLALLARKDDGHLLRTVREGCQAALAALVAEGAVSFDRVVIRASAAGLLDFVVFWTDLARGVQVPTRVTR